MGKTALHVSACFDPPHVYRFLLHCGADINAADLENSETPLFYAYKKRRSHFEEFVNSCADLNIVSKKEWTIFQKTCIDGRFDIAEYLLKHGADVLSKTKYQQEMFKILIKKSPDLFKRIKPVLLKGEKDIPILHAICEVGVYNLFIEFIEKEFDVNALNFEGKTPSLYAKDQRIKAEIVKRAT